MEVLYQKQQTDLLKYLSQIKTTLKEWLFVEIQLTDICDQDFTSVHASKLIAPLFNDKQGALFVCNSREMLLLVRMAKTYTYTPDDVVQTIKDKMPPGSCEANAQRATPEGIQKLNVMISYKRPAATFVERRKERIENAILIADDDLYIRTLVKKCIGEGPDIHEVIDGSDVIDHYKQQAPDILFLDIHLPHIDGKNLLKEILRIDPDAYIVMVSADSSLENVKETTALGAKGFLAKPFAKDKLRDLVQKCPTMH